MESKKLFPQDVFDQLYLGERMAQLSFKSTNLYYEMFPATFA